MQIADPYDNSFKEKCNAKWKKGKNVGNNSTYSHLDQNNLMILQFTILRFYDLWFDNLTIWQFNDLISASANGGPRSQVCARETLRSAPPWN